MEQIIKTLILLGSIVLGVWAIEARYVAASDFTSVAESVEEVQEVIQAQQKAITANQVFFLEDMKEELGIEQFILDSSDDRSEIEEFQYRQNEKRLESINRQLESY